MKIIGDQVWVTLRTILLHDKGGGHAFGHSERTEKDIVIRSSSFCDGSDLASVLSQLKRNYALRGRLVEQRGQFILESVDLVRDARGVIIFSADR